MTRSELMQFIDRPYIFPFVVVGIFSVLCVPTIWIASDIRERRTARNLEWRESCFDHGGTVTDTKGAWGISKSCIGQTE